MKPEGFYDSVHHTKFVLFTLSFVLTFKSFVVLCNAMVLCSFYVFNTCYGALKNSGESSRHSRSAFSTNVTCTLYGILPFYSRRNLVKLTFSTWRQFKWFVSTCHWNNENLKNNDCQCYRIMTTHFYFKPYYIVYYKHDDTATIIITAYYLWIPFVTNSSCRFGFILNLLTPGFYWWTVPPGIGKLRESRVSTKLYSFNTAWDDMITITVTNFYKYMNFIFSVSARANIHTNKCSLKLNLGVSIKCMVFVP